MRHLHVLLPDPLVAANVVLHRELDHIETWFDVGVDRVEIGGRRPIAEIPGPLLRVLGQVLEGNLDHTAAFQGLAPELREGPVGWQDLDRAGGLRWPTGATQDQPRLVASGLLVDVRRSLSKARLPVAEV